MSNIKLVNFDKSSRADEIEEFESSIVDAINKAGRNGVVKTDIIAVLYVQLQAVTQKIITDSRGE